MARTTGRPPVLAVASMLIGAVGALRQRLVGLGRETFGRRGGRAVLVGKGLEHLPRLLAVGVGNQVGKRSMPVAGVAVHPPGAVVALSDLGRFVPVDAHSLTSSTEPADASEQ